MKTFIQHKCDNSDKLVLQALVPFTTLNSKALFTQKVLSNNVNTDKNLYDVQGNADYYQRRLDYRRLLEIKKYIYNSILDEKENIAVSALFPSSMILSVNLDDSLHEVDGLADLCIEEIDKIFIVDGQHRLMAMRLLYEDLSSSLRLTDDEKYIYQYLSDYKFGCTILVNYDLWEQGQVFVNVNFKQKPVNRSLYYDVFGAEYIDSDNPKYLERNKIYLAHELTRFMNDTPSSPFYKMIKMLGTGSGCISQAFFVEALLRLFKPNDIWFFDNMPNNNSINLLGSYKSELYNYYKTIAECFNTYWDQSINQSIHFICKTTGVGAFTRLMSDLHKQIDENIFIKMKDIQPGADYPEYTLSIKKLISPIIDQQDKLFGPSSKYFGTGGKGLETELYKEMAVLISKTSNSNNNKGHANDNVVDILRNWVSNKTEEELYRFGVKNFAKDLYQYLQINIPLEIKALGANSKVLSVYGDHYFTKVLSSSNNDITIAGSFSCKVVVSGDKVENSFTDSLPGNFIIHYKKDNNQCIIVNDGTKIYINTDRYYR